MTELFSMRRSWWVLVAILAMASVSAQAKPETADIPNQNIGAREYPDFDAVILQREQSWTLQSDGTVRRRDHQWVKLLDARAIVAFADPRIDYCLGRDEMKIHASRTILPNGKILPVPDYAFSKVGPDDISGWPQYAGWTQMSVSFSGVENGCILELDYEVVSKPGMYRWVEADLRLNEDYPTVKRIVTVTLPKGVALAHKVDNLPDGPAPRTQTGKNGEAVFQWTFERLAGAPGEPQSLPWTKRCGRLRFTSCAGATEWVGTYLKLADEAAKPDETIQAFARKAVEQETDPVEQVKKVAKKLGDSFSFLNTPKALHPFVCREAGQVLSGNYGNLMESGAVLAAALRSLGLKVTLAVATDANVWDAQVPTETALTSLVALVDTPSGLLRVHPQQGLFKNPGSFGRRVVLSLDGAGKLRTENIQARHENQPSHLEIDGKVTLAADGKATGELRLRLTGGFYEPSNLETAGQQEALVKSLVGRVLGDCEVTGYSVTTLSDELFRATAKVASKGELKGVGEGRLLRLGEGAAFLTEYPLPLGRSYRKTDVFIGGALEEAVDLTIELPKGWTSEILPPAVARVSGDWGAVERTVKATGKTVTIARLISLKADTLPAKSFDLLREALAGLRGKGANVFVAGPAEKSVSATDARQDGRK